MYNNDNNTKSLLKCDRYEISCAKALLHNLQTHLIRPLSNTIHFGPHISMV